jgi:hypothetical protein
MANIYDWLEDTEPISYAPTSPVWTAYEPTEGMSYAEDPMDPMIFHNTGGNDNMPPTWIPIDPSLSIMANASAPADPVQDTDTVLERLIDNSNRILVCVTQILETARLTAPNGSAAEPTFTAEELEILAPIPEEEPEPAIPGTINGLCVNMNPQAAEIECIIDSKRIRPSRQTFFLAKTIRRSYYWFHSPHANRDHSLSELIGEFRRNARNRANRRRTGSSRELRSGRMVGA